MENLEKIYPPSQQLIVTVRNLSGVTTSLGRARAFLRSSLLERTLADYWRILVEENPALLAYQTLPLTSSPSLRMPFFFSFFCQGMV